MNLPYFIARRLSRRSKGGSSPSRVMIRIAIISVALSITFMLIAVAVVEGFKREITDKVAGFTGNVQLTYRNLQDPSMIEPFVVDEALREKILGVQGVTRIESYATANGMLQSESGVEGILFRGVENSYDWTFIEGLLVEGELPDYSQESRSREVILPAELASKMSLTVGDVFNIIVVSEKSRRDRFRVAAIYRSGMSEFDSRVIIGDITTLRRINDWGDDEVEGCNIFTLDNDEAISDAIFDVLPMGRWNLDTLDARFSTLFDWIRMLDANATFILVIMIIVAVVNMLCGVLVIVLESIQMIGILKSQGATTALLQKIFLYRSGHILLWGLLWGNLIGIGLCAIQYYFGVITLDPDAYLLSTAPVWLSWSDVMMINAGSFLIITLMMILPTLLVERISPAESIKYS